MATTIIDRLVLELGLDPKQFNKGAASAAAEVKTVQDQVSYSAGEMVGALQRVAAEFVGLFLAAAGVKDVVGMFSALNESTRQLGIESRNLGESAAQLRDWGNISQIAGGKAEDAANSIAGLEKSIFNVKQGFGWDDQLTAFLRLNVDTGVATGHLRDFHALLLDTAKALESKSREDRFQWVQKLGLQGGIGNAVVDGPQALERYWRQQQSIPQISGADTAAAQRLAVAFDTLKDRVEAWAAKILTAVEPAIEGLFNAMAGFLTGHQQDASGGINYIAAWVQGPGPQHLIDALTDFADTVVEVIQFIKAVKRFLHHPGTVTWEWIKGGIKTDRDRAAEKAEIANGLPAFLLSDTRLPADIDPAHEAKDLVVAHQQVGGDARDPTWGKTIRFFLSHAHYDDTGAVLGAAPNPDALKAQTGAIATPLAGLPKKDDPGTPTASKKPVGMVNNITGDIFVQSQATDPNSVAGGMNGALQRKLTVSQSDGALH